MLWAVLIDTASAVMLLYVLDIEPAVELEEIVNSSQHKHSSVSSRKLLKAGKKNNTELLAKRWFGFSLPLPSILRIACVGNCYCTTQLTAVDPWRN